MFTGLIQALGKLTPVSEDQIQINCGQSIILTDLAIGDSVAVDGVCLTVTKILTQGFQAIASPETLRRTTLGQNFGNYVNLETSLRTGSKIGGHFVSGHVDGVGYLDNIDRTAQAWEIRFTAPSHTNNNLLWQKQIAPYLVTKGSIAVNGISLTVADCDFHSQWFVVAVIPHSFTETNLQYLKRGDLVNIESDILGKYVAKLLRFGVTQESALERKTLERQENNLAEITPEFLLENGFMIGN